MNIRIEGLDEVLANLDRVSKKHLVEAAIETYARSVQDEVDDYPPISEANLPPAPYYKRGYGTVTSTGVRRTSEMLGKKWHVQTGSTIALENKASYSGWVQGREQTAIHRHRGWKNAPEVAQQMIYKIKEIYDRLFEREWR